MILLQLLVLISPSYGLFCEHRWMIFENSCYNRFEAAPSDYINTCRRFKSVLVENVTNSEAEFFKKITVGGPMGSGKGDFICKKPAASKEIFTPRTRPWPRNELDCAGNPRWFGLNETKRCYSMQFSHQPLTWDQANTRCQNWFNGTLATMKTELEYNHVINVGHFGTYALTYEQPLVGYRMTGNEWKWVDGTQGGITLFHGGIPDPKLNLNCVQLTTDIAIQPDHQVLYNGVFGRMVPVPCNQRFQRYVCSVDHATFLRKFPGPATTTTPTPAPTEPETYCPARWLKHNDMCYRIFQSFYPANDCATVSGEDFEVPENSTDELFQKILIWKSSSPLPFFFRVCIRPTSNDPPVYNPILSEPRNDFDCVVDGWKGLNITKKCYKYFTKLDDLLSFEEMRQACQGYGGSLLSTDNYPYEMDFLTQLGHIGVDAFVSELPVVEASDLLCGGMILSDFVFDGDGDRLGSIGGRVVCSLSSSYICEVDYEELKQRNR